MINWKWIQKIIVALITLLVLQLVAFNNAKKNLIFYRVNHEEMPVFDGGIFEEINGVASSLPRAIAISQTQNTVYKKNELNSFEVDLMGFDAVDHHLAVQYAEKMLLENDLNKADYWLRYAKQADSLGSNRDISYLQGMLFGRKKLYENAQEAFQLATQQTSGTYGKSDAYFRLGRLQQVLGYEGDTIAPIEYYESALKTDDFYEVKNKSETYRLLGDTLFNEKKYLIAADSYLQAIRFNPSNYWGLVGAGKTYYEINQQENAELYLFRAIQLNHSKIDAHVHYVRWLGLQKNFLVFCNHLNSLSLEDEDYKELIDIFESESSYSDDVCN